MAAIPITFLRCMALIVPVVVCSEVLCCQARRAKDAVREALAKESGTLSPATLEQITQLNASLASAREALQPLLVIGVGFFLMWGSLAAVVWLGQPTNRALFL